MQPLGMLIDCLYFHSKMDMMILREIVLISITCHLKDFDTLIDNKPFFDKLVKNKQESC